MGQVQAELDRLWLGSPAPDGLHLAPAWVLVHYQLGFDGDTSSRTTDVTDEEIDACL